MRYSVTKVTPPTLLPVDTVSVKNYLRITGTDEDAVISDMLLVAVDMVEQHLRRSLLNRTLKLTLDGIPPGGKTDWWDGVREGSIADLHQGGDKILLPAPPLVSVTSFVSYDYDNTAATFDPANYIVDTAGSRIILKSGSVWPVNLRDYQAVEITYVAGYGAQGATVPPAILGAIRMIAAQLYENRDCPEMPVAAERLLAPYRVLDSMFAMGV